MPASSAADLGSMSAFPVENCLVDLAGKESASRAADLRFNFHLCQDFPWSSHTSDLKIGTPVAWLPWKVPSVIRTGLGLSGPV